MITTSSKDWGLHEDDAWIYGIVVGWDTPAIAELAQRFCWSNETANRLRYLNEQYSKDTK